MRFVSSLLVLVLLDGCVNGPYRLYRPLAAQGPEALGYGGSAGTAWGKPGRAASPGWSESDEDARKDEESLAIDLGWGIASTADSDGALVQLTYWSSGGALTLVQYEVFPSTRPSGSSGDVSFRNQMRGKLASFAGTRPRFVRFTFRRGPAAWTLSSFSTDDASEPPLEGRALPVRQAHLPEANRQAVERLASTLVGAFHPPGRPGDEWLLGVKLVDDRILSISTVRYEGKGKASFGAPLETVPWEMTNAIVPFLPAVGDREVQLLFRAEVAPGETRPRWHPLWAATLHEPLPEMAEFGTSFAEYRLLEEGILRQWREQTRDYAQTAVLLTAREVAIWFIGGWIAHGVGMVMEFATSPLWRMMTRLGPEAAGWMECLLVRVPRTDQQALLRLWSKVERGGGVQALSAAERNEFRTLLDRIEQVASKPLNEAEKDELRDIARTRYRTDYHPELVNKLVDRLGKPYPVHHEIPLEYAHLFPEIDINAAEYLVAVAQDVHDSIGKVWTVARSKRAMLTAADVRKISAIINQRFKPWYNTVYNPASAAHVKAAESAAIAEVRLLLANL